MARVLHTLFKCRRCGSRITHAFGVHFEGRTFHCSVRCRNKDVRIERKHARWRHRREQAADAIA